VSTTNVADVFDVGENIGDIKFILSQV